MMNVVGAISSVSDAIRKESRNPQLSPLYGCIPLSEYGVARMESLGIRCEASSVPGWYHVRFGNF